MTQLSTRLKYFVAVSPGLEALLLAELAELGVRGSQVQGGVECSGSSESLWCVHHYSHLAESVRVRLRPFEAHGFAELEQNLRRIPWHAYLRKGDTFTLSVTSRSSRLYHTEAIAERVTRVIQASLAGQTSIRVATLDQVTQPTSPPQRFHVRVQNNLVQVSVDASGERLHRRGYRTHVGDAPLRETLAAATIRALRQQHAASVASVWDPCCGSGTLLAEWLIAHLGWDAYGRRNYAFENWPVHDEGAYTAWLGARPKPSQPAVEYRAYGSDKDPRCIDAARHNLAQAQLLSRCELLTEDFRSAARRIPHHTAVVSNLPYGVRLSDAGLASRLFRDLDGLLWERKDLRPVVLLHTFSRLPSTRCEWHPVTSFANGGLRVTAWATA